MRGGRSKDELKIMYPKHCPPPGEMYVSEWADAQLAHGLKQLQCACHGLWLFPQQRRGHAGPFKTYEEFLRDLGRSRLQNQVKEQP